MSLVFAFNFRSSLPVLFYSTLASSSAEPLQTQTSPHEKYQHLISNQLHTVSLLVFTIFLSVLPFMQHHQIILAHVLDGAVFDWDNLEFRGGTHHQSILASYYSTDLVAFLWKLVLYFFCSAKRLLKKNNLYNVIGHAVTILAFFF